MLRCSRLFGKLVIVLDFKIKLLTLEPVYGFYGGPGKRWNSLGVAFTKNVSYFGILKKLGFQILPNKKENIIPIIWVPPPPTFIKVNIHVSVIGSPGVASCGGLFRNSRGFPHRAFSGRIDSAYAFEAELWAA